MLGEERPREGPARISCSYSGFHESFAAKPLTRIARVDAPHRCPHRQRGVATGEKSTETVGVIHKDRRYMGYVNTSPALPDILTYCHEGRGTGSTTPRTDVCIGVGRASGG